MVDDPNRKTPRQFQCRDYLWESFEQMSTELECSIDYLINEAMRHYLRAQGRSAAGRSTTSSGESRSSSGAMPAVTNGAARPSLAGMPRAGTVPPLMTTRTPPGAQPSVPPVAGRAMPSGPAMQPPMPAPRAPAGIPSIPPRTMPPMPAGRAPTAPPVVQQRAQPAPPPLAAPAQRVLFATCEGQELPVEKEEFFIGRGQKMCDLVIRDTNISRQHARVVLHNGAYWIIDNQSTNGIEFRGAKIQNKRVEDGDVFTICGHDVQFRYR
jgi:hypothetical protein